MLKREMEEPSINKSKVNLDNSGFFDPQTGDFLKVKDSQLSKKVSNNLNNINHEKERKKEERLLNKAIDPNIEYKRINPNAIRCAESSIGIYPMSTKFIIKVVMEVSPLVIKTGKPSKDTSRTISKTVVAIGDQVPNLVIGDTVEIITNPITFEVINLKDNKQSAKELSDFYKDIPLNHKDNKWIQVIEYSLHDIMDIQYYIKK